MLALATLVLALVLVVTYVVVRGRLLAILQQDAPHIWAKGEVQRLSGPWFLGVTFSDPLLEFFDSASGSLDVSGTMRRCVWVLRGIQVGFVLLFAVGLFAIAAS